MKKRILLLSAIAITVIGFTVFLVSCKKDIVTEMTIDKTATPQLDIGDEAIAVITIKTDGVKSFKYYKLIDDVRDAGTDAKAMLVRSEDTYTYNFSYEVQEFDDLHTLGFEFELTDDENLVKTVGLVVNINISIQSMFVKYDWKVIESTDPVWGDVLSDADAAIIYRFNEDGTYEEDLSPTYAADNHHFCYWVYKETPSNGDTIAVLRLVRRLKQLDTAIDEYYDYKITAASESQMSMFWEIKSWGLKITNKFQSQAKGAFVPYGTVEMEGIVNANASLNCSNIDDDLLIIP